MVRDSGCGMDEQTLRRIFEPFFTTKNLGRGLGLSSVVGIVGAHHGELSVESEVGIGTCFTLLLPLSQLSPLKETQLEDDSLALATRGQRVLAVDDDASVLEYAVNALERLGYQVETASDGVSGLRKLLTGVRVHAVLLGSNMRGLTEQQFMRELEMRGFRIPIVLSTGSAERSDEVDRNYEIRAGVLHKPYALTDLAKCLRDAISPSEES